MKQKRLDALMASRSMGHGSACSRRARRRGTWDQVYLPQEHAADGQERKCGGIIKDLLDQLASQCHSVNVSDLTDRQTVERRRAALLVSFQEKVP